MKSWGSGGGDGLQKGKEVHTNYRHAKTTYTAQSVEINRISGKMSAELSADVGWSARITAEFIFAFYQKHLDVSI